MWDVITDLVRSGSTLLLTTQYLEDRQFDARRITILDIGLSRPSLDDVFLALTGHAADDAENTPDQANRDRQGNQQ